MNVARGEASREFRAVATDWFDSCTDPNAALRDNIAHTAFNVDTGESVEYRAAQKV